MIIGNNSTDFDEFLLVLGVLDPNREFVSLFTSFYFSKPNLGFIEKSNLDEGSIEVMTKSDLSTSTSTSTNK